MYTVDLQSILNEPETRTRQILCRKVWLAYLRQCRANRVRPIAGGGRLGLVHAETLVRKLINPHGVRQVSFLREPSDLSDDTRLPVSLIKRASFSHCPEWELQVEALLKRLANRIRRPHLSVKNRRNRQGNVREITDRFVSELLEGDVPIRARQRKGRRTARR